MSEKFVIRVVGYVYAVAYIPTFRFITAQHCYYLEQQGLKEFFHEKILWAYKIRLILFSKNIRSNKELKNISNKIKIMN